MGFFRHHAIIVTCVDEDRTARVCDVADKMGFQVSKIIHSKYEQSYSFFIAPDGAKELTGDWSEDGEEQISLSWSEEGDERRNKLIAWFVEQSKTRSIGFDWVELEYGGDTHDAKVLRHSDDPRTDADKEVVKMIPVEPVMTLNRSADALSTIVPVAITTPCPRCGGQPLNIREHLMFDLDETILQHCEFYAVAGDITWVNAKSCEKGDPTPFLRVRAEMMRRQRVSV